MNHETEKFTPKGSVAFFILLALLCVGIWFYIYNIMLERA
jgi:uncharacterized membrane protein